MPDNFEVSGDVTEMAQELIAKHHPWLKNAKIGFAFRDKAPTGKGKITMGQATKVSPKFKPHLDLDFLIWLAFDVWNELSVPQRYALIDHELCHCVWDDTAGWIMLPHDVEEFWCIIKRYGLWTENLQRAAPIMENALQMELPELPARGGVISVRSFELAEKLKELGAEMEAA